MRQRICMALVLIVAALGTSAFAQPLNTDDTWGRRGTYQRNFNPATVESIAGEVVSVDSMASVKGWRTGIHLTVRTDKEQIPVHLGPAGYIERLGFAIVKGDEIEVKGSRVVMAGKPAIIAAEVKKGEKMLVLRDSAGVPAWSRRGR